MKRTRKIITLFIFIFWFKIDFAQEAKERATITSFLNDVLTNRSFDTNKIMVKYMDFQPASANLDTKQRRKRKKMLKKHLAEMKKKYGVLYDAVNTKIVPYDQLDPQQQIPFDVHIRDHVYAVVFSPGKIMYMYVDGQSIKAFELFIQKGTGKTASAYFLTY
ncbi:hypothetical protein GCM10023231_34500 [Olivibacter ginsenosidimutans]|uniref:DUF4252 domain-containing protein n=1 Tax=Olivibacter ginsenosidimutans TaxID=1176537 RepID=A0ABP9BZ68_9SPHI